MQAVSRHESFCIFSPRPFSRSGPFCCAQDSTLITAPPTLHLVSLVSTPLLLPKLLKHEVSHTFSSLHSPWPVNVSLDVFLMCAILSPGRNNTWLVTPKQKSTTDQNTDTPKLRLGEPMSFVDLCPGIWGRGYSQEQK